MSEPTPAEIALRAARIEYRVIRHAPARSLVEAAELRGIAPSDIVKTLVVRRTESDFFFALVPGDREISWPKLRAHLGVSRLSMPDANTAFAVTGYQRGTITPFGARQPLPVIADATIPGRIVSLSAGEPGATVLLSSDAALTALGADIADISRARPLSERA